MTTKKKSKQQPLWTQNEELALVRSFPFGTRAQTLAAVWLARPPDRRRKRKWDAIRKHANRMGVGLHKRNRA